MADEPFDIHEQVLLLRLHTPNQIEVLLSKSMA
jgi:hypothetical protein